MCHIAPQFLAFIDEAISVLMELRSIRPATARPVARCEKKLRKCIKEVVGSVSQFIRSKVGGLKGRITCFELALW